MLSDLDIALLQELSEPLPLVVDPLVDTLDVLEKNTCTKVLSLLCSGANPNACNANGETPLGLVAKKFTRTSEHAAKIIQDLVDRGANPMAFDEALLKFSKSGHLFVKENFVVRMVFEMCRKQAQAGIEFQDEQGRNPVQLLISKNISALSLLMLYIINEESIAAMEKWLSAKDERGNTALHLLWKDNGVVSRLLGNKNATKHMKSLTCSAWHLHQEIESIAPGQQWEKNIAGIRAYDLLSRRIDEGLLIPDDMKIGRQVISHRQAEVLRAAADISPLSIHRRRF